MSILVDNIKILSIWYKISPNNKSSKKRGIDSEKVLINDVDRGLSDNDCGVCGNTKDRWCHQSCACYRYSGVYYSDSHYRESSVESCFSLKRADRIDGDVLKINYISSKNLGFFLSILLQMHQIQKNRKIGQNIYPLYLFKWITKRIQLFFTLIKYRSQINTSCNWRFNDDYIIAVFP